MIIHGKEIKDLPSGSTFNARIGRIEIVCRSADERNAAISRFVSAGFICGSKFADGSWTVFTNGLLED